jgi:2-polyprenyl-3-methyl-5-hydroxy-6-metoxy-1,4-benzoquinol methylase
MEKLLPEHLKDFWQQVERHEHSTEDYTGEYERALTEYRQIWQRALILPQHDNLRESLVSELGRYTQCSDLAEVRVRCEQAVVNLKREWENKVLSENRQSIEQFYDETPAMIYELMWWHALGDDLSPLAYVLALRFAQRHGCQSYLDFGAGVGAGGLLFASHGIPTTLADISSSLLRFSAWRLGLRKLPTQCLDLKHCQLPDESFDFITAMDVFEHLTHPMETVEKLWNALKQRGFLYVRISADPDEDRPQHIVNDFEPTFERMRDLGFVKVWHDDWLWGHQVFQKP